MQPVSHRPRRAHTRPAPVVLALIALAALLAGCGASGATTSAPQPPGGLTTLRIGYQKYGTLNILKARGDLEQQLGGQGVAVEWTEFPGGPQLLEALNAGSIDFGHTGEAPPIFAQAAGAPLVYVANEPPSPASEAILVPGDSPITSVAELKGQRVALNKGSNVHFLLVRALEANQLSLSDIEPIYLPPAEARAAFQQGSVAAWVIWDPFFGIAEAATGARVLQDGQGLVANREFYLATRALASSHPQVVQTLVEAIAVVDAWASDSPSGVAELLAPQLDIEPQILERVSRRRTYGVQPVTDEVIADQQLIADTFFRIGLLPEAISVTEATLR